MIVSTRMACGMGMGIGIGIGIKTIFREGNIPYNAWLRHLPHRSTSTWNTLSQSILPVRNKLTLLCCGHHLHLPIIPLLASNTGHYGESFAVSFWAPPGNRWRNSFIPIINRELSHATWNWGFWRRRRRWVGFHRYWPIRSSIGKGASEAYR